MKSSVKQHLKPTLKPTKQTNISALQSNDLDAVAALIGKIPFFKSYDFTQEKALKAFQKALQDPIANQLWKVTTENTTPDSSLQGVLWVMPKGGFGLSPYLRLIAIDPKAQGTGLGKQLMLFLEEKYLGNRGLFLFCESNNLDAKNFYSHLGYQELCKLSQYAHPKHDELLFFKNKMS